MSKIIPTTIELDETTFKNLTNIAKAEKKTVAEVINDLLYLPFGNKISQSKENPLTGIIGIASTGLGNAARNHDTYLYQEASPHK